MFTKKDALLIARKLEAEISAGRRHDIAVVEQEGIQIAQFGIRRGSKNNCGHDHLPCQIHLSPHETSEMVSCTISKEEWLNRMREKGLFQ